MLQDLRELEAEVFHSVERWMTEALRTQGQSFHLVPPNVRILLIHEVLQNRLVLVAAGFRLGWVQTARMQDLLQLDFPLVISLGSKPAEKKKKTDADAIKESFALVVASKEPT